MTEVARDRADEFVPGVVDVLERAGDALTAAADPETDDSENADAEPDEPDAVDQHADAEADDADADGG